MGGHRSSIGRGLRKRPTYSCSCPVSLDIPDGPMLLASLFPNRSLPAPWEAEVKEQMYAAMRPCGQASKSKPRSWQYGDLRSSTAAKCDQTKKQLPALTVSRR